MVYVFLGLAILYLALVAGILYGRRPSGVLRARERRQTVVTLKGGGTFEGVLYEYDGEALILRNAVAVGEVNAPESPVDGELLVLWADVAFLQLP